MPSTNPAIVSARPRVRIDGADRPALGEAAAALSVHLPASGMASAELRVINWGPANGGSAGGDPGNPFQDLRLGSRIEFLLGETAESAVFSGDVTAIEERYGDGAPQLVILAEDPLHKLARSRASRVFENKGLADVVREIASDAGLQADVSVDAGSADWLQHNESHLAFLLRVLSPHDIPLRMQGGRLRARPEEADANPVRLDSGINAQRIRIIADLNRQPREVLADGYNLASDAARTGAGRAHGGSDARGTGLGRPLAAPAPLPAFAGGSRIARTGRLPPRRAALPARRDRVHRHARAGCRARGRARRGVAAARRALPHRRLLASLRQRAGAVYAPARRTPGLEPMSGRHSPGPLQDLHLGVVLDNADPDNRGRVKLRLPATGLEVWAAVMVPSAGSGYGVSLLPRQNEQVVVAFISPDLPIVLGAVWSGGSSQPADARPVEERYFVQSPAGIKVLLDDQEPKVKIETPAGNHLTITDQGGGKVTIEQGGEKVEMSPGNIKITGSGVVKVEAAQVTVSAGMVKVDAGMSKFSGVVQCDTLISNAVISSSYTPGAGNIW